MPLCIDIRDREVIMPIPKPRDDESEDDFIIISAVLVEE